MRNVKVYNWGVAGVVSGQELSILIHTAVDYKPDLVVIYDGAADIFPRYADYDPRPGYPMNFIPYEVGLNLMAGKWTLEELVMAIFRKSHIFRRIFFVHLGGLHRQKMKLRKESGYGTPKWESEIASKYAGNHEKMCRVSMGYGFKFASFLQPLVQHKKFRTKRERPFMFGADYTKYFHRVYKKARAQLKELQGSYGKKNCLFVDISGLYENDKKDVFYDGSHTYDYAKPKVAQAIVSHIEKFVAKKK